MLMFVMTMNYDDYAIPLDDAPYLLRLLQKAIPVKRVGYTDQYHEEPAPDNRQLPSMASKVITGMSLAEVTPFEPGSVEKDPMPVSAVGDEIPF